MNNGELFDPIEVLSKPLPKGSHVRNMIGDVAARFACEALEAEMLPIKQNQSVCPDFSLKGMHGEIKSVGMNRQALIYKWRIEKEEAMFGLSYLYVFVLHSCPITCANATDVTANFRDKPVEIVGCTIADLRAAIGDAPVRKFSRFKSNPDPSLGYNRAGYADGGWQFPIKRLPEYVMRIRLGVPWMGTVKPCYLSVSAGWMHTALKSISTPSPAPVVRSPITPADIAESRAIVEAGAA